MEIETGGLSPIDCLFLFDRLFPGRQERERSLPEVRAVRDYRYEIRVGLFCLMLRARRAAETSVATPFASVMFEVRTGVVLMVTFIVFGFVLGGVPDAKAAEVTANNAAISIIVVKIVSFIDFLLWPSGRYEKDVLAPANCGKKQKSAIRRPALVGESFDSGYTRSVSNGARSVQGRAKYASGCRQPDPGCAQPEPGRSQP